MSPLRPVSRRSSAPRPDRELRFELASFEYLLAGEGVALLRLAGSWHARPERLVPEARLVMLIGGVPVAIPGVPDPTRSQALATPEGSPWRGAFRVSAEVIDQPGIDFRLEAGEVAMTLPRPSEHARAVPAPPPAPEQTPDADPQPRGGEDHALRQIRELEARLRDQEQRADRVEERATLAEVEYVQARAELEQAWGQAAELRTVAEAVEERTRRAEADLQELEAELAEMRQARVDEAEALDAERQAIEAELLRITQADAEREALEAEVEVLRRQIEDGGTVSGDRVRMLEEEIERRVTAEHDLRARLETQEAELGAARAAADSRARELQDAEHRIAQAAVTSRAASATAAPGQAKPQFDDEVMGRIAAAKEAAALVGE